MRARRPAAAPRAPTPSGATARTPTAVRRAVGPAVDGVPNHAGGIRLGSSSKWIGDYTIEPENGGVGVFSHEFGHDLGLPDEYDTSGNTGGAENSTAWWTPGRRARTAPSTASTSGRPRSTQRLGQVVPRLVELRRRQRRRSTRRQAQPVEHQHQAGPELVVVLPDKKVTKDVGAPSPAGKYYFSGRGNNLDTTMTRPSPSAPVRSTLSFTARWHIEKAGTTRTSGRRRTAADVHQHPHSSVLDGRRSRTARTSVRHHWGRLDIRTCATPSSTAAATRYRDLALHRADHQLRFPTGRRRRRGRRRVQRRRHRDHRAADRRRRDRSGLGLTTGLHPDDRHRDV